MLHTKAEFTEAKQKKLLQDLENNHITAVHANVFFYSAVVFCSRHLWFHSCIVTWNGMESISFVSLCYFSSAVINVPTLCQTKKKKQNKKPLRKWDRESVWPLAAPNTANRDEQTVVYSLVSFFESSTKIRRSIFLFLILNFCHNASILHVWLSPRCLKAPQKNNLNLSVLRARSLHNTSLLDLLSPGGG